MRCPYCSKAVRDMPVHLERKPECSKKHAINLLGQLKVFMNRDEVRHRCGVDVKQPPCEDKGSNGE